MTYFLLIILSIFPAFADLDKIQIMNLDFNYVAPHGTGEVEKVSIGIALRDQNYPVEVYRRDHSFEVLSTFIDFEWLNPTEFFHNMISASTQKLNLKVDKKDHYLRAFGLKVKGEKTEEFIFSEIDFACSGSSVSVKPIDRVKADCLEKMQATVSHMNLPFKFLTEIAAQLPDVETEAEGEIPANDFLLSVAKGDFYSHLRVKSVINAYLKIWGHGQYENNGKTFAIRVDTIKYGPMPVTHIVMLVLQNRIKHPRINIRPPWIRIQLGDK